MFSYFFPIFNKKTKIKKKKKYVRKNKQQNKQHRYLKKKNIFVRLGPFLKIWIFFLSSSSYSSIPYIISSLSVCLTVFVFFFFFFFSIFWLKDFFLIFVWRRRDFFASYLPAPVFPPLYARVCMRVECVWLNTFEELCWIFFVFFFFFFGVGICFLIFGSSIVFNWW